MKRRDFVLITAGAALAERNLSDTCNAKISVVYPGDVSWEPNEPLTSKGLSIKDVCDILKQGEGNNISPVLREEILENPDAVFIINAGVENSKDSYGNWKPCHDQMENLGRRVAELVFRKGTAKGGRTFLKPNLCGGIYGSNPTYINGIVVHPYFTVGMADILHDLGNTNTATGARGALRHNHVVESGLGDLFDAHNLPLIEAHYQYFSDYDESELVWHENPEGVVARRFCTYKPVFEDGTTFINIAHAHTHKVGHTTLTMKNLQGILPRGYGHVCDSWATLSLWRSDIFNDFNPNYRTAVEQSYVRHGNMGYQYWDDGSFYKTYLDAGGYDAFKEAHDNLESTWYENSKISKRQELDGFDAVTSASEPTSEQKLALYHIYKIANSKIFWAEQWAQRMIDMIEVLPAPYLSMVEGVFSCGHNGLKHSDFITLGRSMVSVDAVTSWLMGHDPRGIPYMRIAKERGIGENDISNIPIYILDENGPRKIKDYKSLERTYLGINNYNLGKVRYFTEPVQTFVETEEDTSLPHAFVNGKCYPNPFNSSATIQYEMSHPGNVVIKIFSMSGQCVDTIMLGKLRNGTHEYVFDGSKYATGQYIFRIETRYSIFSGKMILLK